VLSWGLIGELAREAVLPAAGASGLLFYALVRWRGPAVAAPAAALALAAGFLLGNRLRGAVALREDTADLHRAVYAAGAALLVGLLARAPRLPVTARWALRAAGAALAAWWLTAVVPEELPLPGWKIAVLLFGAWAVCEQAPQGPLALALAALAAAVVLLHAHTARLAEAALLLASALAGLALVAPAKGTDAGGSVPGAAVLLAGLLLSGHGTTYSEVPPSCFLLIGAAPLALAPTLLPFSCRLAGPRLGLLRAGLVLAPLAVAVARAMSAESVDW
jgi:hypothetical protein